MQQPTPASQPEQPKFAAFVAIDWADREHVWSLEVAGAGRRESGQLEHTPEAIDAWAAQLGARFAGRPVAVALEQSRGALFYALRKYGHLVLHSIPPTASARYRALMFPSGSKDDPKDADLQLDLLVRHPERCRVVPPDSAPTRKLQMLVEKRRQMVEQRTAQTNRITDLLKLCFPQALQWLDRLDTPLAQAFLQRWPTLEKLQAEEAEQIQQFFRQQHSRSKQRIQQRMQAMRSAKPLLRDEAILDPVVTTLKGLLGVVAALRASIAELDREIQQVLESHPEAPLFASFPGAGAALTPRLVVAFGSQRERYTHAEEVASFSGIAPVTVRSGQQQWIHFRWACPKFLRQTFHEYAAHSIVQCAWAREFYQHQREKGQRHHAAVRALAYKWIRIMFRCWKSGTPYQEDLYLKSLQQRRQTPAPPPSSPPQPEAPPPKLGAKQPPRPATSPPLPDRSGAPTQTPILPATPGWVAQPGAPLRPAFAQAGTVEIQFKKSCGFWKFSAQEA
jgi:transposase